MDSYDEEMVPELTEEEQAIIEKQTGAIEDQEVRASLQSLFSTGMKSKKKKAPRV
jgi:hypothetical protein